MKTTYKLFLIAAAVGLTAACKQTEPLRFTLDEGINFYAVTEVIPEVSYPDELTKIYKPNTWYNRRKSIETVKVDFSVQSQGHARDFDRKAVFMASETTGWQIPLPVTELIVPANEYLAKYVGIPIDYVPFGRMTKWVIVFDYEKGDFAPGNAERQTRTITIDNRYTIAAVNLGAGYWEKRLQGGEDAIGFGTWSNIKTMFLVETFGFVNFRSELYDLAGNDPAAFEQKVREAAAKLEEYKANSASDPDGYPPLLDDELNDGSWIKFNIT